MKMVPEISSEVHLLRCLREQINIGMRASTAQARTDCTCALAIARQRRLQMTPSLANKKKNKSDGLQASVFTENKRDETSPPQRAWMGEFVSR